MEKINNIFTFFLIQIFKFLMFLAMIFTITLQFIVPITIIFILFDFLLFLFEVVPAFMPSKYLKGKFFEVRNYERVTSAILFTVAIIINIIYWDLVKDILLGLIN